MLRELLDLMESKWLRPEQIEAVSAKMGVRELEDQIYFLRELKELARLIPLKAYSDTEQRPRLLDAIQQAMDMAIEREEEEFECTGRTN